MMSFPEPSPSTFISAGHWRNRYLLMRHGHSQANQAGIIISSPEKGLAGYGLSPYGEEQLAGVVSKWVWPIPTRIVHSDFLRTTQTAARVAAHFGLPMIAEQGLRERFFGAFDAQPDTGYPEVWAQDIASADHCWQGVEAVSQVAARMHAVIDGWEARTEDETILLVSHGDPLQILLTALARQPLTRHRDQLSLAPASITLVG
ncbi:histidine phosphatase family protein [Halomonas sp. BLK-85]